MDPGVNFLPVDFSVTLPATFDPRTNDVPIENQLNEGDCTANGTCGSAMRFLKAQGTYVPLSEDFNYKTGLLVGEGAYPTADNGSTPIWALKGASQCGICTEATWPSPTTFSPTIPSVAALAEGLLRKADQFYRINFPIWSPAAPQNLWAADSDYLMFSVMYALAKGWTVQMAFGVGNSIFTLPSGAVYQPIDPNSGNQFVGYHEVEIVGWTIINDQTVWICRNSWGPTWSTGGYFYAAQIIAGCDATCLTCLTSFNGQTSVGPDITVAAIAPIDASTCQQIVDYVFKTKFGRMPAAAGEAFWTSAVSTWLMAQIIAGAAPADMAYMAAHPVQIAPTFVSTDTLDQIVTTVFQTYFGRAPLPAGESYWAAAASAYFTTQIVAGAGAADKSFMAAHGIT